MTNILRTIGATRTIGDTASPPDFSHAASGSAPAGRSAAGAPATGAGAAGSTGAMATSFGTGPARRPTTSATSTTSATGSATTGSTIPRIAAASDTTTRTS